MPPALMTVPENSERGGRCSSELVRASIDDDDLFVAGQCLLDYQVTELDPLMRDPRVL